MGDTNKITPCNTVKRVTCCTNFTVHLIAPTDAGICLGLVTFKRKSEAFGQSRKGRYGPGMVKSVEEALVVEWPVCRMKTFFRGRGGMDFSDER